MFKKLGGGDVWAAGCLIGPWPGVLPACASLAGDNVIIARLDILFE
jgi:hypothetical protein